MTFARSSIIARTSRSGSRSPTPAAWLRTRLTCSSARRSGGIATSESLPNPVVTPYTAAPFGNEPLDDAARPSSALAGACGEGHSGAVASDRHDLIQRERIAVENYFVEHGGTSTRPPHNSRERPAAFHTARSRFTHADCGSTRGCPAHV